MESRRQSVEKTHSLKEQLHTVVKRYPLLQKLALKVLNRSFFKEFSRWQVEGRGNQVHIDASAFIQNCQIDIVGHNNAIWIEEATRLHGLLFYIRGNHNQIRLSPNVRFNRGGELWMEDDNGLIQIGERTAVEEAHIAVTETGSSIRIGADCLLARGIDIRTGDSHSLFDALTGERINYARNVEIADHVWIAAHSSVLKGVRLAQHSVVATRSVVTKSFEQEGVLIGGNPARVLKENIDWYFRRVEQRP